MGDFWEKMLGTPTASTRPSTAPREIPWWERTAINPPMPAPESTPAAQPVHPTGDDAEAQSRARTQWARQAAVACPSCGSNNYHAHPDAPNARARCYDCGYPISQSGTGMAVQGENVGPVKEARQTTASRTNDFNPANVFHHMG